MFSLSLVLEILSVNKVFFDHDQKNKPRNYNSISNISKSYAIFKNKRKL